MKTLTFNLVKVLLIFFMSTFLKAQIPAIDSLRIIPAYPTSNDTVKVISRTIFPSGGCAMTASAVNIYGSTVNVFATHTLGLMTVICSSTDTICIGKLNARNYDLIYNLALTTPPQTYDIDTLHFVVQQFTGLLPEGEAAQKPEIYPNPLTTTLNIRLKNNSEADFSIVVYGVLGQKIKSIPKINQRLSLDISELKDGIYFMVITDSDHGRWVEKIIKKTQ
ncbi:MAG: T9SS type A sorting domain-containing protein [Bacteroidales bacterium]